MAGGKKERTRDFIIETARKLFCEKGFSNVTMKDVCDSAQISRGCLYSHFSGTAEIFVAVLGRLDSDSDGIMEGIAQNLGAPEILERALSVMREEMADTSSSLSLAMTEFGGGRKSPELAGFWNAWEEKWMKFLEYGIRRNEFSADGAGHLRSFLFAYQGARLWSLSVDFDAAAFDAVADTLKKGIVK